MVIVCYWVGVELFLVCVVFVGFVGSWLWICFIVVVVFVIDG